MDVAGRVQGHQAGGQPPGEGEHLVEGQGLGHRAGVPEGPVAARVWIGVGGIVGQRQRGRAAARLAGGGGAGEPHPELDAVDEVHQEQPVAALAPQAVVGDEVRVPQIREGAELALEAHQPRGPGPPQHLQRQALPRTEIFDLVHLTGGARPEHAHPAQPPAGGPAGPWTGRAWALGGPRGGLRLFSRP